MALVAQKADHSFDWDKELSKDERKLLLFFLLCCPSRKAFFSIDQAKVLAGVRGEINFQRASMGLSRKGFIQKKWEGSSWVIVLTRRAIGQYFAKTGLIAFSRGISEEPY